MMTPNVPQFLSWVAGRTTRVKLGTMVTGVTYRHPGVLLYSDAFGVRPVLCEMARELAGHTRLGHYDGGQPRRLPLRSPCRITPSGRPALLWRPAPAP